MDKRKDTERDYGLTPEQYHACLARLWDALPFGYLEGGDDVFGKVCHRIDALKAQNEKLREACETFVLWMDREDGKVGRPHEGWGEIRKTPEGERQWRRWYDENIRICDLACTKAREALGVI